MPVLGRDWCLVKKSARGLTGRVCPPGPELCCFSFSWGERMDSPGKRHICVVVYLVCTKAELASGLRDAHSESCHIALHRGN